jgi:hypothetical protein
MEIIGKSQREWIGLCEHYRLVQWDLFDSELRIPTQPTPRHHPAGPVTLTIRIHYSLNFADGSQGTLRPGVMYKIGSKCYVQDANWHWFEVVDWNFGSSFDFANKFKSGEAFWDSKFMLFPSDRCAAFDYTLLIGGKEERWRPNILCRFELVGGPILNPSKELVRRNGTAPVHLSVDVIRSERPFVPVRSGFRSDSGLYDARHVEMDKRVLWHELGHAIDQDHIQALVNGQNSCANNSAQNGEDHCYVTPPWIREQNIMGKGNGLILENGRTWFQAISEHLASPSFDWIVSRDTTRPPRLIRVDDPIPPKKGNRPGFRG